MRESLSHVYQGIRLMERRIGAPSDARYLVLVDGQPLPQTDPWARYGLEGFTWGFQSVGTEALAHALLSYELGEEVADCYFSDFSAQVIALLPAEELGDVWSLTSEQIRDWLSRQLIL